MELDQEAAERCRALAQRIVRELAPRSVQVLENSGLLEEAFDKMNTTVVQSSPELLVVADPQWVTLPAVQAEKVVLVCDEYTGMADCAKQLAAQGFCREFAWKDSGKEQLSALFCRTAAPELPELETGYEQQLDILRERTVQAERTAAEQAAQLERLRSDLSLSRSHEQDLEKTLNSVVNSTFWRASWPLRYLVSKCRQLWRTFPLFVFFATLRRVGFAGVMAQAKAKREYKKLFPGKAMPADRFADVELLVKQAADRCTAHQHRGAAVQHPPRFSGGAAGLGAEPDLPQLGAVHGGCRTGRGRGCPCAGACPHRQPHPLPETGQQRGHCGQHQSGLCPCHG